MGDTYSNPHYTWARAFLLGTKELSQLSIWPVEPFFPLPKTMSLSASHAHHQNCPELSGSETLPYLQASKLVWQFCGCWQKTHDSRFRHKGLLLLTAVTKVAFSCSSSQAPISTGQSKEGQVIPVHAQGCITGEELWAQGTQIFESALCYKKGDTLYLPRL